MEFVNLLAKFLRTNLFYVAVALVATTLAIYGVYLKRALKNMTRKMNFLLRYVIYVFVYAFGLGFLTAQVVIFIEKLLGGLNNTYLVLAVVFAFLLLCLLARNEKQI